MQIHTNHAIDKSIAHKIGFFWDKHTPLWNAVWGPHIHHGYYSNEEVSNSVPQEVLLDKLITMLNISPSQHILDVGCGIGETAFYLAQQCKASVIGITLSRMQLHKAQLELKNRKTPNVQFKIDDAHSLSSFKDETFDIVWSLESCEQFADKPLFIKQAHRVLKPGGKLMIATWCSDKASYEGKAAKDYKDICQIFCIPYMPTIGYYDDLIKSHFNLITVEDWSLHIKHSWEVGLKKLDDYSIFELYQLAGFQGLYAVHKVHLLADAFLNGAIRYGVFIAQK